MNDEIRLAGRGRRFVATLIDAILVPSLAILIMLVTGVMEDAEDYVNYPVMRVLLLGLSSYLILNGWLLWKHGQTVGKAIMGIAIARAGTSEKAALWRLLVIRGPFFALMFAIILGKLALIAIVDNLPIFTRPRRCIHDWLAGTIVVDRRPAPNDAPAG